MVTFVSRTGNIYRSHKLTGPTGPILSQESNTILVTFYACHTLVVWYVLQSPAPFPSSTYEQPTAVQPNRTQNEPNVRVAQGQVVIFEATLFPPTTGLYRPERAAGAHFPQYYPEQVGSRGRSARVRLVGIKRCGFSACRLLRSHGQRGRAPVTIRHT